MAEYYSAELSQKTIRGKALTASKFLFNGGHCIYGYMVDADKKLIINPVTAPIVIDIFERYLAAKSMAEVIRYLNDKGIQTGRGAKFGANSLRFILANRAYLGIYRSKGKETRNTIPKIIPNKLFNAVQAKRKKLAGKKVNKNVNIIRKIL